MPSLSQHKEYVRDKKKVCETSQKRATQKQLKVMVDLWLVPDIPLSSAKMSSGQYNLHNINIVQMIKYIVYCINMVLYNTIYKIKVGSSSIWQGGSSYITIYLSPEKRKKIHGLEIDFEKAPVWFYTLNFLWFEHEITMRVFANQLIAHVNHQLDM